MIPKKDLIVKGFRVTMTEKDLGKFNDIKERFGFLTDAEALRFIINHYYEKEIAPMISRQDRAQEEK